MEGDNEYSPYDPSKDEYIEWDHGEFLKAMDGKYWRRKSAWSFDSKQFLQFNLSDNSDSITIHELDNYGYRNRTIDLGTT